MTRGLAKAAQYLKRVGVLKLEPYVDLGPELALSVAIHSLPTGRFVAMPMITVRILEGHSKQTKQKIATGFMKTVTKATGMQPSDMWIVFEDVPPSEWYVGDKDCTS